MPQNDDVVISFMCICFRLFTAKNKCNMLTISAEIKRDGKRLDGTYNVKLRFTLGRKVRRKSTTLFASPKDITKDLEIKLASHFLTYYYQTSSTLCVIIISARSTSSTT